MSNFDLSLLTFAGDGKVHMAATNETMSNLGASTDISHVDNLGRQNTAGALESSSLGL